MNLLILHQYLIDVTTFCFLPVPLRTDWLTRTGHSVTEADVGMGVKVFNFTTEQILLQIVFLKILNKQMAYETVSILTTYRGPSLH